MISEAFKNIKTRVQKPKAYALLFKHKKSERRVIWQVAEYSLEDAIAKAKHQVEDYTKNRIDMGEYDIDLYTHETIDTLFGDFMPVAPSLRKKQESVSVLMQRIIDEQNFDLFEEKKSQFNEAQVKYLEERLNQKDKR